MADQNLKIQLTAIDKTQRAFAAVRGGLKRVSGSILNVRTALVGLAGAAGLQQFATQIDDLAKASSRLGLTVNELQSLQFAASQTGASSEELEKGLTRFSRAISEASTGIGTGLRSFEALGITITDAQGGLRPTSELLNEVSDRLSQIQDPADRVRIAFDLFGRSGVNLVNTLQNGSGTLKQLQNDFNAVTMELTGEQAKSVEEANDRFDKLGRILSSVGQQITANLLEPLSKLSEFLLVQLLKGFNALTSTVRNTLNFLIDVSNELTGLQTKQLTFGIDFEKEVERIVFNLENASNGVEKLKDGTVKMKISLDQAEKSLEKANAGFERVNNLAAKNVVTFDEFGDRIGFVKQKVDTSRTALEKYIDSSYELSDALQNVTVDSLKSLEDSFAGLVTGTTTAKDAFRNMANSILADLSRIAAKKAIAGIVGGGGGGIGSIIGGIFGRKAIGGSVQAGQPYMVGERGAEMFVPNQSGAIVPNNQLGGGGAVTVNQTVNLTTGVAQTVRTEVMNMLPQIQQAAVSAVLDARRRGGSFGSAFGG